MHPRSEYCPHTQNFFDIKTLTQLEGKVGMLSILQSLRPSGTNTFLSLHIANEKLRGKHSLARAINSIAVISAMRTFACHVLAPRILSRKNRLQQLYQPILKQDYVSTAQTLQPDMKDHLSPSCTASSAEFSFFGMCALVTKAVLSRRRYATMSPAFSLLINL